MPDTSALVLAVLLVVYLPPAVVLAWVDGREHRLPNRWVAMLTGGVGLSLLAIALLQPGQRRVLLTAAVLAAALGTGAILLALLAPPVLGMGDAKSVPVVVAMSAALGGEQHLAGGIGTVVVLVTRRPGVRFALGPVLLAGPFLGLCGAPMVAAALGTA